ncbi:MAG: glycoside hydrolase family 2 protein [Armatimonadota bacterium]
MTPCAGHECQPPTTDDLPRPEHPRPDFHRGLEHGRDWLNLNGRWQFEFDPDDVGEKEGWHEGRDLADEILVPFCWEAPLAWGEQEQAGNEVWFSRKVYREPDRVTRDNYRDAARHEIGWYRRTFEAPQDWLSAGKRVILHFGAADFLTKVWVNGEPAGEHEGGYTPFEFDLTDLLVPAGEQTLVVRCYDAQDHSQQPAGKQWGWYTRTSGIWQTVYLEPRGPSHLSRVHIRPDVDDSCAHLALEAVSAPDGTQCEVEITGPQGEATTYMLGLDGGSVAIDAPRLWEPEEPHLYDVTVRMKQGEDVLDEVHTYFGMRKVETKPLPGADHEYIWLNDHPVYLLGALDQSFNPWGIYTFPSDGAARDDIQKAKDFGLNFLRLHIKLDEPRLLYWADRLGVMLMCDLPNWGHDGPTDLTKRRYEEMLRAAIERDYNHPSIVAWCLFNETWGLGRDYKENRNSQDFVRDMYRLAKELDTTRLVEDNSPCRYDHVMTDINSWHFYINDYQKARDHIRNVVENTRPGSDFNYVGGARQGTQPLMNSEYGGIGARMGDRDVSWCFHYLTNELRLHEKICGYVYTEHMDIEWEHNGFMNYDRTVKEFGYDLRHMNSLDFLALDHPPDSIYRPGERLTADVYFSHFSARGLSRGTLKWRLAGNLPDGSEAELLAGEAAVEFEHHRVTGIHRLGLEMPQVRAMGRLEVWLEDEAGTEVARNFLHVDLFPGDLRALVRGERQTIVRFHPATFVGARWWPEGPRGRGSNGSRELVGGRDVGYFEYAVDLPQEVDLGAERELELLMEASACRAGLPQTDCYKCPSEVTVSLNNVEVATVTLPDAPCDTRGAMSYIRGLDGRYGYLLRATATGDLLRRIARRVQQQRVVVRLGVRREAEHKGGITIYSSRCGRYPMDPQLIIRH